MNHRNNNIIITGIPRSGTTLAAAIIDSQENSICLNEPDWHHASPALDASEFARAVIDDFSALRGRLLAGEAVPDRRNKDGNAITNYYDNEGKQIFKIQQRQCSNLSANFTLAIKHNGPYLAVLPELIKLQACEIFAVIRHPLPIIRSWRRLNLPISRGEMPNATAYWPELRELVKEQIPLLQKQAKILELIFCHLLNYQKQLKLIRYEEMITANSNILNRELNYQKPQSDSTKAEDQQIITALNLHAPQAMSFYS